MERGDRRSGRADRCMRTVYLAFAQFHGYYLQVEPGHNAGALLSAGLEKESPHSCFVNVRSREISWNIARLLAVGFGCVWLANKTFHGLFKIPPPTFNQEQ